LSEFATVCVACPMSITYAPGANVVSPVTGLSRVSRASRHSRGPQPRRLSLHLSLHRMGEFVDFPDNRARTRRSQERKWKNMDEASEGARRVTQRTGDGNRGSTTEPGVLITVRWPVLGLRVVPVVVESENGRARGRERCETTWAVIPGDEMWLGDRRGD